MKSMRDLDEEKRRLAVDIQACPALSRLEKMCNCRQADDSEDSLELLLELQVGCEDVVRGRPRILMKY